MKQKRTFFLNIPENLKSRFDNSNLTGSLRAAVFNNIGLDLCFMFNPVNNFFVPCLESNRIIKDSEKEKVELFIVGFLSGYSYTN